MNRSIRKSFRKKHKGAKVPLWEESLANLNALMKKNPETVDEKKMNVLVSAMIELQQEYRASVAQCEKLKSKVAELTKEVEDKDTLLQERSLQIEAAHFRISGLTYLESTEKDEEEEKKSEEDDHGGDASDGVEIRSGTETNSHVQKLGGVRRHRPATEVFGHNNVREKMNGSKKEGMDMSPMGMGDNIAQWKNQYPANPYQQRMDSQLGVSADCSLSPSSVQDVSVGNVVEIVETLEI